MTISESLRRFRDDFGLTQKQVADSIGVHYQSYQRYELGNTAPLAPVLVKIADVYDVSMDYLTGRTPDPKFHGVHLVQADVVESAIIFAREAADKRLAEVRAEGQNPDTLTIAREYADTLLRQYHELTKEKT